MNVLVALSATAAFVYSVYSTFIPQGTVFYDASAVVITTITLGHAAGRHGCRTDG